MTIRLSMILAMCGAAACAEADPPEGYYDSITGTTGPTIKSQLTTLTNQAIFRSYDQARNILQVTDEDPDNPANVILMYNGQSVVSTWDSGSTWNREHCWPRSLGVGSSGNDNSDLHMLRACNPSVNSSRGNKQFGTNAGQWDPDQYGEQYRGEMARVTFYANTRYTYLNMAVIGSQQQLVDWHFEQMPDAEDVLRNDRVYLYQQNRNPYVDHPEWVWPVYGTGPSDAQITVAGSSTVDLGAFISDGTGFSADVQLNKTGAAPTTYLVSVTGDVSSDSATGFQAGFARGAQSQTIPVSIASGTGPISGTVRIDTTELTSAGAGLGSADADDVVTFTGLAMTPAVASLEEFATTESATLDLGEVNVGAVTTFDVPVWNLASASTGAALDIDSAVVFGGAGAVSMLGAPQLGIIGGDSGVLTLRVEPATLGAVQAVATITVSDEDVPGATSRDLVLVVQGEAVTGCPADVNGDGLVTPGDFNAWVLAFNTQAPECDVNGDGECTPGDFNAWVLGFNQGC